MIAELWVQQRKHCSQMSLSLGFTSEFPVPHLRHFFPYLESMAEPGWHTEAFAELCQSPALSCWRSLSPSQDVKQFYILSKPLSASRLYFRNPPPLPYVLGVQGWHQLSARSGFPWVFFQQGRRRGKVAVAVCQLLAPRAPAELGHNPSHVHWLQGFSSGAGQLTVHSNARLQHGKRDKSFLSPHSDSQNEETWLNLPFQSVSSIWPNGSSTEEDIPVRSVFLIMLRRCQMTGSPPKRPELY